MHSYKSLPPDKVSLKSINLRTFASLKQKKGLIKSKVHIVDDRDLFSCLVIIAHAHKYDLQLLFTYELTHIPLTIATYDE